MYWIVVQLVILVFTTGISFPQELSSTLRFTEYGVPFAFVGEMINFTCRTEGSNSIGWSSMEYIGVNRVNFASRESNGTTRPPTESGAVARLISSSRVNGTVILVSQLQITVQSMYQIASVTCHNIGIDTVNTSSFRMDDNTMITCDERRICPGQKVSCACTTAHSITLAWSSDQLIGGGGAELVLNMSEPLLTRRNASNFNTSAVLSDRFDENGVVVLKSELSFVFPSTSFNIILTCENVDSQNSYSVILPIHKDACATTTTTSIDQATTDEYTSTTSNGRAPSPSDAAGVSAPTIVVSILFGATMTMLLLVLIFVGYYTHRKLTTSRNGKLTHWKRKETVQSDCTTEHDSEKDDDPVVNSTSVQGIPEKSQKPVQCKSPHKAPILIQNSMYYTEEEDETCGSDASLTPALKYNMRLMCLIPESETGGAHSVIGFTRRMEDIMERKYLDNFPLIIIVCQKSSSFTMEKMEEEMRTRDLKGKIYHYERQIRELTQELQKKNHLLVRKEKELEQQKTKLREIPSILGQLFTGNNNPFNLEDIVKQLKGNLQMIQCEMEQQKKVESETEEQTAKLQKGGTDMIPVQASVASEHEGSEEANVVRKRDRLLVARTGNERPSIPNTGLSNIVKEQQ